MATKDIVGQAPAVACANHRRRPRVATCGTCGKALCADCIVHTPVGIKCRTCTGVKGVGVSTGAHATFGAAPAVAPTAERGGRRRPWAVALVAAGVVVLAVAGYGLVSGGGGSSSPVTDTPGVALGPVVSERNAEFVAGGGLRLGGTLTVPAGSPGQGGFPAVLIIPGLGAVDRNGVAAAGGSPDATRDAVAASLTVSALGSVEPVFKDMSQTLAKAGIASFRYDKRGTAASKLKPEQKLSFDDEVADARAALDFLAQRQEVGTAPIAVLGHDQGGLVAIRAASGNPRVKALVLASTPSRPLADVLADDLSRSRGPGTGDEFRTAASTLKTTGKVPEAGSLSALLQPLFPAGQEAYLTSILSVDPTAEAAAVTVPTLVVRGGGDLSVSAGEAARLSSAVRSGAEVMTGAPNTDRNLALPGPGHEHSNTVTAPVSNQDADLIGRLAVWLQTKLHP